MTTQTPPSTAPLIATELRYRLVSQIVKDHGVDPGQAHRVVTGAITFLMACARNPDMALRPSKAVDIGWHRFILNTRRVRDTRPAGRRARADIERDPRDGLRGRPDRVGNWCDLPSTVRTAIESRIGEVAGFVPATAGRHSDLHAQNILVNPDQVAIIDWAWARCAPVWVDPAFLVLRLIEQGHTVEQAEGGRTRSRNGTRRAPWT